MPLTLADIQQAIAANPTFINDIATGLGKDIAPILATNDEAVGLIIPKLTEKGFVIRAAKDEESFLTAKTTEARNAAIKARDAELYQSFDASVFEAAGIERQPNEQSLAYAKRAIAEIKTSKVSDPVLKEQLTAMQAQLAQKDTLHKTELEKVQGEAFTRELTMMFTSALDKISIAVPAHLKTDEEKQQYVSMQKNMMKRESLQSMTAKRDNEGNVVFYSGETPLLSTADSKPLGPEDILKKNYALLIDNTSTQQQGGAGTGGKGQKAGVFTTEDQLHAHMKTALGFEGKELTKPYYDKFAELKKQHGIL